MNILIVENDSINKKRLSTVLKAGNRRIFKVACATPAFKAIKACYSKVILLDLRFLGMDGLARTRRLEQNPAMHPIPLVAITAEREKFSMEEALNASCDAFIVKPVDTHNLFKKIVGAAPYQDRPAQKEGKECTL